MNRPKAVLFDNDGLLLDTESVWTRGEEQLFATRGREFTIDHKLALVGCSEKIAAGRIAAFLDEPGNEGPIMEELNEMVLKELEGGVDAMVGGREILEELKARDVPVALVSNSPMAFIHRSHEVAATGMPFDVIVSGHEVPEAKPAPDAYLEACRQLGIGPDKDSVALEDSPSGVTAAAAAGLFVIGVPSVPGITLEQADMVADSLGEQAVVEKLLGGNSASA